MKLASPIRDRIDLCSVVTRRLRAMGIRTSLPRQPRPGRTALPNADRIDPRECVDQSLSWRVHLRQILQSYARYYNDIRTHRSLDKMASLSSNSANRKHQITPILGFRNT